MNQQEDSSMQDLTATFLNKRVKATAVGMLTARHTKKYQDQQGTVIEILEPDHSRGVVAGLKIFWDDGSMSKSLAYMVEIVT